MLSCPRAAPGNPLPAVTPSGKLHGRRLKRLDRNTPPLRLLTHRRDAKFAGLLHHIYPVEPLEQAYYLAVKRDAAARVDGQTWAGYGQDLEANLLDLSDRLARGGIDPSL